MASSIPNRGPELLAVDISFLIVAITAYALRCYVRIFMVKAFGRDDYLMAAATVRCFLPSIAPNQLNMVACIHRLRNLVHHWSALWNRATQTTSIRPKLRDSATLLVVLLPLLLLLHDHFQAVYWVLVSSILHDITTLTNVMSLLRLASSELPSERSTSGSSMVPCSSPSWLGLPSSSLRCSSASLFRISGTPQARTEPVSTLKSSSHWDTYTAHFPSYPTSLSLCCQHS